MIKRGQIWYDTEERHHDNYVFVRSLRGSVVYVEQASMGWRFQYEINDFTKTHIQETDRDKILELVPKLIQFKTPGQIKSVLNSKALGLTEEEKGLVMLVYADLPTLYQSVQEKCRNSKMIS